MNISSRTPEGDPARCPMCESEIVIEPSVFLGDGCCPNCGQLIWFIHAMDVTRTFSLHGHKELRERVLNSVAEQLGVPREKFVNNPTFLDEIGADSLDAVELVAELEEEFNDFGD